MVTSIGGTVECFHSHATAGSAYAGMLREMCESNGYLFTGALDFLFSRPASYPVRIVLVGEGLMDSLSAPKAWEYNAKDIAQRPVLLGQNEQNVLDPNPLEPDPVTHCPYEIRRRPSDEQVRSFVALACALKEMSSSQADKLNESAHTQPFREGDQALVVCVPRFRGTASYYEIPPHILLGEVMLHELVHLRQSIPVDGPGRWVDEMHAQWLGFEAALALHQPIATCFVYRAVDLPLPYRLFLRSPKAYEIWGRVRDCRNWADVESSFGVTAP